MGRGEGALDPGRHSVEGFARYDRVGERYRPPALEQLAFGRVTFARIKTASRSGLVGRARDVECGEESRGRGRSGAPLKDGDRLAAPAHPLARNVGDGTPAERLGWGRTSNDETVANGESERSREP